MHSSLLYLVSVLYNGRFLHSIDWWISTPSSETKGVIHRICMLSFLSCWVVYGNRGKMYHLIFLLLITKYSIVIPQVHKRTKSVNNRKSGKTVMSLTWYRHFQRNGGSNQILRPQTTCFHYGLKVPVVTITVFSTLARPCLFSYPLLLTFHMH